MGGGINQAAAAAGFRIHVFLLLCRAWVISNVTLQARAGSAASGPPGAVPFRPGLGAGSVTGKGFGAGHMYMIGTRMSVRHKELRMPPMTTMARLERPPERGA